jgi:hypothetical protein
VTGQRHEPVKLTTHFTLTLFELFCHIYINWGVGGVGVNTPYMRELSENYISSPEFLEVMPHYFCAGISSLTYLQRR